VTDHVSHPYKTTGNDSCSLNGTGRLKVLHC
jgi:hypothetical protein